jgi:hypothetical protein
MSYGRSVPMVSRRMLLIIPILVIITITTTTNAFAHTSEYQTGFYTGPNVGAAVCNMFAKGVPAPGTITVVDSESIPKVVSCQDIMTVRESYDNSKI